MWANNPESSIEVVAVMTSERPCACAQTAVAADTAADVRAVARFAMTSSRWSDPERSCNAHLQNR
jgi:hypothetical protein